MNTKVSIVHNNIKLYTISINKLTSTLDMLARYKIYTIFLHLQLIRLYIEIFTQNVSIDSWWSGVDPGGGVLI